MTLQAGCSGAAIAALIGVSPDTLYRRCQAERDANFSHILQEKRAKGDAMLRMKQFSLAMNGDRGMLIWLGKQRLGQKDQIDNIASDPLEIKIVHYGASKEPATWN